MSKVDKYMESARELAKGTLEMWVSFETPEEVKAAEEWKKGKRQVKNLTPILRKDAEKIRDKSRKETAKKLQA